MDAKTMRLQLMLSEHELSEIEEFRWRNRVRSQSEAVRQLIKKGLEVDAKRKAETV